MASAKYGVCFILCFRIIQSAAYVALNIAFASPHFRHIGENRKTLAMCGRLHFFNLKSKELLLYMYISVRVKEVRLFLLPQDTWQQQAAQLS